jgi:hypothetical protein
MNPFSTEQEAIDWVRENIPILIKPTKKGKYPLRSPFSSGNAFRQITEHLGKRLFEHLNK